jgi:hypothetical protein
VEGERKQLTVLFADVQGSMDLQEKLDPEVWPKIMGCFVQILAAGIRRSGGTVDQFTGDGIMALFGAPVAQEDHARRACHAAWHLTKAAATYAEDLRNPRGVDFHVHLGLNSGEVVLYRVGSNVRFDRSETVTDHRRQRPDPRKISTQGRQRELAALEDALAAATEGHAQVVGRRLPRPGGPVATDSEPATRLLLDHRGRRSRPGPGEEVASRSLLSDRRARLHAAVAKALLEHDPARSGERAAVLSWHWERAGQEPMPRSVS